MGLKAQIQQSYSIEEFLRHEDAGEFRSENIGGQIYAMAGGTDSHIQISFNITKILAEKLRDICRAYQSETKVRVEQGNAFYYPDVTLVCGEQEFYHSRRDVVENPILLVEVLSESTKEYDKNDKFFAYQTIETFKEYLLVSQGKHLIQQYIRQDDGNWKIKATIGIDSTLYLESVEVAIPMRDVYDLVSIA
ncbi:MAG: Uma2 family endonuclease [Pyrinomonadaceae bacterium]